MNIPLFPEQASTVAKHVDALFFFILAVTVFFTLLVVILVAYFAVKYRREKHPTAIPIHGNIPLEITWSAIPLVITEIASAVDSVPVGDLSLVRPSSVRPLRNSRNTVTTRRISSSAAGTSGSASDRPSCATRRATISTSSTSGGVTASNTIATVPLSSGTDAPTSGTVITNLTLTSSCQLQNSWYATLYNASGGQKTYYYSATLGLSATAPTACA